MVLAGPLRQRGLRAALTSEEGPLKYMFRLPLFATQLRKRPLARPLVIDFDLTRMKGIDEKKVKVRVGLLRQRGLRAALTSEEGTLKYMFRLPLFATQLRKRPLARPEK
jgi:hypothetical protein